MRKTYFQSCTILCCNVFVFLYQTSTTRYDRGHDMSCSDEAQVLLSLSLSLALPLASTFFLLRIDLTIELNCIWLTACSTWTRLRRRRCARSCKQSICTDWIMLRLRRDAWNQSTAATSDFLFSVGSVNIEAPCTAVPIVVGHSLIVDAESRCKREDGRTRLEAGKFRIMWWWWWSCYGDCAAAAAECMYASIDVAGHV